jgi:hypothetical protein
VIQPLLKPCQMKRRAGLPYKRHKDGREVCLNTPAGRKEYRRRVLAVWDRDKGICGWCLLPVSDEETTGDHIKCRGAGGATRDDRETNLRPAHCHCNGERGSSPILTRAEWLQWNANRWEPLATNEEIQLIRDCGYEYPEVRR